MIRSFASSAAGASRTLYTSATRSPRLSRHTHEAFDRVMALQHRDIQTTKPRMDFHFDTHHFVQRLEREGLNRAQAEGIMAAMAEVIDESIRNMTSNMVTKADQEKVRTHPPCPFASPADRPLPARRPPPAIPTTSTTTRSRSTSRSSSPSCSSWRRTSSR